MSETLRTELAEDNVFITTVCPGLVRSGSSDHAKFKGQAEKEHAWFTAASTSTLITITPEYLARKIVNALVEGRAELTTPLSAKIEATLHGLMPNVSAEVAGLVNKLLPAATAPNRTRRGGELVDPTGGLIERRQRAAERPYNESE